MRRFLDSWARLAIVALVLCASTGIGDETKGQLNEAEFQRLAPRLRLRGGMWDLPWQVSITDARRVALKERKPIFMIVNTGNCLGFV